MVQHVLKAGLAHETDLFFMAVIERGTGETQSCVMENNVVKEKGIKVVFHFSNFVSLSLSFSLSLPRPARLQATVVLNPRYPDVTPLFSLSLLWKGERSGRTDDNLRVREGFIHIQNIQIQLLKYLNQLTPDSLNLVGVLWYWCGVVRLCHVWAQTPLGTWI